MFHTMIRSTPGLHSMLRYTPDLSLRPRRTAVLITATLSDTYLPMITAWLLAATRRSSSFWITALPTQGVQQGPLLGRSRHRCTKPMPRPHRRGFEPPNPAPPAMPDLPSAYYPLPAPAWTP